MTGLLRSLFGKGPALREGDYFFVAGDKKFYIHKVLRKQEDTLHILTFEPMSDAPQFSQRDSFEVLAWHAQIARSGLRKPTVIGNTFVSLEELQGYHVYLRGTDWVEAQIVEAQRLYKDGVSLHDKGDFKHAIEHYTATVNVFPMFFEAIDNKGLCYMSLGDWQAAAQCFEDSIGVDSSGLTAIFSLGECNMRLENYAAARPLFEQAAQLDPTNADIKVFQSLAEEERPHPDWIR